METDIEQAQERLLKLKEESDKLVEDAKEVLAKIEELTVSCYSSYRDTTDSFYFLVILKFKWLLHLGTL